MHLTHPDAWHCYAGGTSAADDRNGYDAYTTIGRYMIQPVSSKHNVQRHIGYSVMFCNEKGAMTGGLYQPLNDGKITTLPHARRVCRQHAEKNSGTLVPEQIPGAHT